jgi:hypothetical protein
MRITPHLLRSAALAATIAALPAIAPSTVQAQGKGHKYGHDKDKGDKQKVKSTARIDDRDYDDDRDGYYQPGQPTRADRIPPGQRPRSGMCRIWIDGVPPGRQPKATDCATAEANVPPNARVIYGNDASGEVERTRRGRTTGRTIPGTIPGGNWPYLSDALAFSRGTRTSSVASLVPGATNVRLSSRSVNGVPVEAMFYGAGGQLLEVWRDQNGDGRADRVTEYRNGQVVADYRP